MSGIATAVVGAAVVGGVVASSSASKAAKASTNAAKQQAATATETLALQKEMYDADVARNKPFYDLGVGSIPAMQSMVSGNYDPEQSPAARYELQQGSKSLNRQLAARGLLGSGNASQRYAELATGVAAKDYNDQYNRILDQIKVGTGASAQTGQSSANYNSSIGQWGSNTSNAQGQAGQAKASLYAGQAGLVNNTISTGINAYNALGGSSNTAYNGNTSGLNASEYNRIMSL